MPRARRVARWQPDSAVEVHGSIRKPAATRTAGHIAELGLLARSITNRQTESPSPSQSLAAGRTLWPQDADPQWSWRLLYVRSCGSRSSN
jgi:hypothetical protein